MNPAVYEVRIISSLRRGYRPGQIADYLGLSIKDINRCLQSYQRKYHIFSRKDIVTYFGGDMVKRCGRCKSEIGKLLPVKVTSRGKQWKTFAHLDCIPEWRRVSVVELDTPRIDAPVFRDAQEYLDVQRVNG